ncbi:MAG: CIA30 family protein [Bacteroidales bacterium]|nr:CIA30 family protein [Bacteroidales bacterium]
MTNFLITIIALFMTQGIVLFDFKKDSSSSGWYIVDDSVMGGRSEGAVTIDSDGHGVFEGTVSLDNNGGFSSVRYRSGTINLDQYNRFVLRVKGDGKSYQFRVSGSRTDRHSYTYTFATNGDWQLIEIPFAEMTPTFRGFVPDIPNFHGNKMEEMGFLIGNKKAESFRLLIDRIGAE